MNEIWVKISDFPLYSVSSYGRVRNDRTNHILKPYRIGNKGNQYYAVDLYPKKCVRVHRLVAKYFIPNADEKPQVNHIDGNHFNNAVNNLEWVTGSENCTHAYRVLGREKMYGGVNPNSKKIVRIEDGKIFESLADAVRELGMKNHSYISKVLSGSRHKAGGYHWRYLEVSENGK